MSRFGQITALTATRGASAGDADARSAVADTLAMQIEELKLGLATGNVGQRPFEMGYLAMKYLYDIKEGKPGPKDPTYTGLDVVTPENVDKFGK